MKKIISLVLCLVMVLSSMSMVFADSTALYITYGDGSKTTLGSTSLVSLSTYGEKIPTSVTVQRHDGTDTWTVTSFTADGTTHTFTDGTTAKLYTKYTSGIQELYFQVTTALKESLDIAVTEGYATYTVTANSGIYGKNSNQGGSATGTWSGSATTTCNSTNGYAWAETFTPNSGQMITGFNIRTKTADASGVIATDINSTYEISKSTTVTIEGMTFKITGNDEACTISCDSIRNDVFVTALTSDITAKYVVTAVAPTNAKVDHETQRLATGSTASVLFTPDTGYAVTEIFLSYGSNSVTIAEDETTGTINGTSVVVTRQRDGSAYVKTSSLKGDFDVTCNVEDGFYKVTIGTDSHITCEDEGVTLVKGTTGKVFTFTLDSLGAFDDIILTTGGKTYTADALDYKILCGAYAYSMDHSSNTMSLDLNYLTDDVKINVTSLSTGYYVTLNHDNGCEPVKTVTSIAKGNDYSVTFEPVDDWEITDLTIKYGDTSYQLDTDDDYFKIAGVKMPVKWDADGDVTITIYDVDANIVFDCKSTYSSEAYITKKTDSYTTITLDGSNPFTRSEDVTVTIAPKTNYYVDYAVFKTKTDEVTVYYGDTQFSLDGTTYKIKYNTTQGKMYVTFDPLYKDLTVSSYGVKSESSRTISGGTTVSIKHGAYMSGYGYGKFGPDNNLTRAEAIQLLCNLYAPSYSTTSYTSSYIDVSTTDWSYNVIAYAEHMGYLSVFDSDSTFKTLYPSSNITRGEFIALVELFSGNAPTSSTYASSTYFTDVSSGYSLANYVNYAASKGWVLGVGGGKFLPLNYLTRAEAVTMLNRILGRSASACNVTSNPFTDVLTSHWAYKEILEATVEHTSATITTN